MKRRERLAGIERKKWGIRKMEQEGETDMGRERGRTWDRGGKESRKMGGKGGKKRGKRTWRKKGMGRKRGEMRQGGSRELEKRCGIRREGKRERKKEKSMGFGKEEMEKEKE